jgi:hypothetical protein
MAVETVAPFIGKWYVQWVSGEAPFVQTNCTMLIGTGAADGAPAPQLSEDYEVCVGFSLLDPNGNPILSSASSDQEPLLLVFSRGTLRGFGFYQLRPLRIYISLAEAQMLDGSTYLSLYASTTIGDPDQVGVWGADGNPPPAPVGGPGKRPGGAGAPAR